MRGHNDPGRGNKLAQTAKAHSVTAETQDQDANPASLHISAVVVAGMSTAPAPSPNPALPKIAPVLAGSLDTLRRLAGRRATSLSHVDAVIQNDPALSLNVLTGVNAELHQTGRAPASTTARAVLVLGMTEFFERAARYSTIEDALDGAAQVAMLTEFAAAHHAAHVAAALARMFGGIKTDDVFAATLSKRAVHAVSILSTHGAPIDTAALTALLPPLARQDGDETISQRCLHLGVRFAEATRECWDDDGLQDLYDEVAASARREVSAIRLLVIRATLTCARQDTGFKAYAAARLLMTPGRPAPAPLQFAAKPAPAPQKSRPKPKSKTHVEAPPTPRRAVTVKTVTPESSRADLDCDLKRIGAATAAGHSGTQILALALKLIGRFSSMRVAVFAATDEHADALKIRHVHGATLAPAYYDLALDFEANPPLAQLLAGQHALHFQPAKHAKLLGAALNRLCAEQQALFHSLQVEGKPIGILLGCRPSGGHIGAGELAAFKRICLTTNSALSYLQAPRGVAKQVG